ncbi:MAG: ATP-binding protein [Actinomycetota bacterium]
MAPFRSARVSPPTRQSLLRGVLFYRWATAVWVVLVFALEVIQRNVLELKDDRVARPVVGALLIGALLGTNLVLTRFYRRDPDRLIRPGPVLAEIGVATTLLLTDVWVYGFPDHAQSVPSVWVVAAVFAVAIAGGRRAALATGFGMGLARYVGWLPYAEDDGIFSLTRIASWVLLVVAGWTAGYLLTRLEAADRSISAYRAREEVARTLHDGVLQTLAVIQRRSDDQQLVELARTQELELREYLFAGAPTDADLASALRAAARTAEERLGLRVDVVCAPDLPAGDDRSVAAVRGAVAEALNNAAKHGHAERVTIYAEPGDDDEVFVSVKDDGAGFDAGAVAEGRGLAGSIRGRIIEAGGRVEIDGRPGRGAEVRLWV